jgi:acetyl esterase
MPAATRAPKALLTPLMANLLDRIYRARRPPLQSLAPVRARMAYQIAAEVLDLPRARLARVEDLRVPVAAGVHCAARLYAPTFERLPVLLYLHGGGFVIGGLETHNSLCRQLALRAQVAVLALDYRKAPEHRFPAAVDDAQAGLRWLFEQAGALGLDPSRVAVAGDSAGATLAAVCAHMARDDGLPLLAQVLITPGTAADADSRSHQRFASGFLLDAATIAWFFGHYLSPSQRQDWRFAPLLAADFEGLAPAAVVLAECDPLVDEGLAYADRLRAAGVAVELELFRGVTHDFIKMGRVLPEASQAMDVAATFLQRKLLA